MEQPRIERVAIYAASEYSESGLPPNRRDIILTQIDIAHQSILALKGREYVKVQI